MTSKNGRKPTRKEARETIDVAAVRLCEAISPGDGELLASTTTAARLLDDATNEIKRLQSIIEPLRDFATRIPTQDNRSTAEPIFTVRQKRRICNVDEDDANGHEWHDANEWDEPETDELERWLDAEFDETGTEPDGWHRVFYLDIRQNVSPFFTEEGAQRFIDENNHNLNEPDIYVESAYRNREWIAVRKALKTIADHEAE